MQILSKPRSIRVLSWRGRWGEALEQAVSRPFTEATGIGVEVVFHVGLRLPAALVSALEEEAIPPVDVVWCNTSPALRAATRGWCEPLEEIEVLRELRDRSRIPEYPDWPLAQAYAVQYVLVYRLEQYPTGAPASWEALHDRRHAGKLVLYPGGNGFYPVAQILGGGSIERIPRDMAPCWSAVASLRAQLGRPDYSIGMEAALARGNIDLCYRALPNALAFRAARLEVAWTVPHEGVADTTDALWVPRGLSSPSAHWARQYIAFALSPKVQERWCTLLGALPMHARANTPELLRSHPRLPANADDRRGVLFVPEQIKSVHEPGWEATFDATVKCDHAAVTAIKRGLVPSGLRKRGDGGGVPVFHRVRRHRDEQAAEAVS